MAEITRSINQLLCGDDGNKFFAGCEKRHLARLAPFVEEKNFADGEVLYEHGSNANYLYRIIEGTVALKVNTEYGRRENDIIDRITNGFVGEEAAVSGEKYLTTAMAEGPVKAAMLPRDEILETLSENPKLLDELHLSLINHLSTLHPLKVVKPVRQEFIRTSNTMQAIGWLAAFLVPILVYFFSNRGGMSWQQVNFLTVFSAAIVMWVFRLVPEYIPALFSIMAVIVMQLVPSEVVLRGYSSGSFFMAMSVFGIGTVLVNSGLTFRLAILILKYAPKTQFAYNISLLFVGFLLTPVLPSANGRVGLISPLLIDMVEVLGFRKKDQAATRLAASAFFGASLLSSVFLTSKSVNFVLFGMLSDQNKTLFNFGYWLYASLPAAFILIVGYLILSSLLFKSKETVHITPIKIDAQLEILGPLSSLEWLAMISVVTFIFGVATESLHKIQPPWIGLCILYILLALNMISKKQFRREIDWPFLIMLGGFVGMVKTMSHLGIDTWIAGHLSFMSTILNTNIYLFVIMLYFIIAVMRFMVPNSATVVLVASVMMPVAQASGINPWTVAFLTLLMSDAWFMEYQCSYYMLLQETTAKKGIFSTGPLNKLNLSINALRLVVALVIVHYWHYLGLIPAL